jgi:hypothetical protein
MQRHRESHLDHGLNSAQIDFLFTRFEDRRAFFIETIELPPELGTVPCGLWGPAMGDPEILNGTELMPLGPGDYLMPTGSIMLANVERMEEAFKRGGIASMFVQLPTFTGAITLGKRGARGWESRLIDLPMRPTRQITVIAGPHEEHACILYTCYGGPLAPQEPTDPKIPDVRKPEAIAFWTKHALSKYAI